MSYYQFGSDVAEKSQTPSEPSFQKKLLDRQFNRHPKFKEPEHMSARHLKVLYFLSELALVCVVHFSKMFYLEAGLSIGQIGILQCLFYLCRFSGSYIIIEIERWLVNTNRARQNACFQQLRSIMLTSVLISTALWVLLTLKPFQAFVPVAILVFFGSITVSSSHGLLDIVAKDTVENSKVPMQYANVRFYGLLAGLCAVGIGILIDTVNHNFIFYSFAIFQTLFMMCMACWLPRGHRHSHQQGNMTRNMCSKGLFNVYAMLFLFGTINAMPEILMLHLIKEFKINGLFLGLLIAVMAGCELFGYFIVACCKCNKGMPTLLLAIVTIGYTAARFFIWPSLSEKFIFIGIEGAEVLLVSLFWISILRKVKRIVPYNLRKSVQYDLENIWHYQSLGVGMLVFGLVYESAGANSCFSIAGALSGALLLYYFIVFHCCTDEVQDIADSDSFIDHKPESHDAISVENGNSQDQIADYQNPDEVEEDDEIDSHQEPSTNDNYGSRRKINGYQASMLDLRVDSKKPPVPKANAKKQIPITMQCKSPTLYTKYNVTKPYLPRAQITVQPAVVLVA